MQLDITYSIFSFLTCLFIMFLYTIPILLIYAVIRIVIINRRNDKTLNVRLLKKYRKWKYNIRLKDASDYVYHYGVHLYFGKLYIDTIMNSTKFSYDYSYADKEILRQRYSHMYHNVFINHFSKFRRKKHG